LFSSILITQYIRKVVGWYAEARPPWANPQHASALLTGKSYVKKSRFVGKPPIDFFEAFGRLRLLLSTFGG